ncbi:MAG TPA: phosphatase PAP2 family protein [Myxococcaceae bacterium]|nr:phosphatase PAP2 family protein [Myxococcaceae bacterium]
MDERRTPLRPLAVLLVLCAAAFLFLKLAGEVREGETQRLDEWVLRSLRTPGDPAVPIGPAWLLPAARNLTALGSVAVLLLIVLAVTGFLALARLWRHLLLVLGAAGGGVVLMVLLKRAFERPRPTVVPPLMLETSPSFPSGHAMMSAVVYLTLGILLAQLCPRWRERIYVVTVAGVLVLLVGLTRLYLGVHYPSDVLGGWSVGLAWALASGLVARALRSRSQRLRAEVPQAEGAETAASPPARGQR